MTGAHAVTGRADISRWESMFGLVGDATHGGRVEARALCGLSVAGLATRTGRWCVSRPNWNAGPTRSRESAWSPSICPPRLRTHNTVTAALTAEAGSASRKKYGALRAPTLQSDGEAQAYGRAFLRS